MNNLRKPYGEHLSEIIRCRMNGMHPREIAEIYRRTQGAIDRILSIEKHKRNLTFPKLKHGNTRWTPERIEAVARQWGEKTLEQLGKENAGVSASRISQLMAIRAAGLQEGTWIA